MSEERTWSQARDGLHVATVLAVIQWLRDIDEPLTAERLVDALAATHTELPGRANGR